MPTFTTRTFQRRRAVIDPILDEFTTREHFQHYHVTIHQGCTQLAEQARYALQEDGKPVAYFEGDKEEVFVPESKFPGPEDSVYTFETVTGVKRLFVRLHALPARYYHDNAADGGLGYSEEFMRPYKDLKKSMQEDLAGFPSSIAHCLAADPNIMNAARLIFPVRTWKHVLHYGMKRLGMWHESFDRPDIRYSDGDNCIEHPPQDFDYSLLIPVMKKFGGWIDFNLCNFTTYGWNERGQVAVVQSARLYGNGLGEQQRFADAVFRTFGVG